MKIYIFPKQPSSLKGNPYLKLMSCTFNKKRDTIVISSEGGLEYSILDFFRCLSADIIIINWPENLGHKRFPVFQLVIYSFILTLSFLLKKKILWILHNKKCHDNESLIGILCTQLTSIYANQVFTHSKDGCSYYVQKYAKTNICYFPHPPYANNISPEVNNERYDIIIWGEILRYKQVAEFLEFQINDPILKQKKILVCGKCHDIDYLQRINNIVNRSDNVKYVNKFLEDELLRAKILKSHIILFTYGSDTVLSSGALIFSLTFCKKIIGPEMGAFKDLECLGLISTYTNFNQIPSIINNVSVNENKISEYIGKYSWNNFVKLLCDLG